MSIRKVSDLEGLNLLSADNDRLNKSLFEISYRTENNDQVQFKSMCTRFESLEEKILNDFRDDLSHRILSAPYGEYLSTFLCCNVETSKTDIVNKNLISYLRFNTNYIVGETSNVISSPHNFIYGEFTFKSKDGTSTILSSNNNGVVFNTTPTVIQTQNTSTLDNQPNSLTTVKYIQDKLLKMIPLGSIQYLDYLDDSLTASHWFPLNGIKEYDKSDMLELYKKLKDGYGSQTSRTSSDTYVIDSTTTYNISYKRLANGMKVASIDQRSVMENILAATGSAWYYLISDDKIVLPVNNNFIQQTTIVDEYGDYVKPGAPNISGYISDGKTPDVDEPFTFVDSKDFEGSGALKPLPSIAGKYRGGLVAKPFGGGSVPGFDFNANRWNKLYGQSDTIQPASIKMQMYMYCY